METETVENNDLIDVYDVDISLSNIEEDNSFEPVIEDSPHNTTDIELSSNDTIVPTEEISYPNEISENTEVSSIDTSILESKLDTLIEITSMQYSSFILFIGIISACIILYVLYKFITKFFEF